MTEVTSQPPGFITHDDVLPDDLLGLDEWRKKLEAEK